MGIPVIYCTKCQEMIPAKDITEAKMLNVEGRNYCYKCSLSINAVSAPVKPASVSVKTPPKTAIKQISLTPPLKKTSIKPLPVSPMRRPAPQTATRIIPKQQHTRTSSFQPKDNGEDDVKRMRPGKSPRNMYLIGGIIGGVVILVILLMIIFKGSGKQPDTKNKTGGNVDNKKISKEELLAQEKKAEDERLAKAKKTFEEITDYEQKNPLNSKQILQQIKEALSSVANTDYEKQLVDKKAEHEMKRPIIKDVNEYLESYNKSPSNFDGYITDLNQLKDKAKDVKNNEALISFIDEQVAKVQEGLKSEAKKELEDLKPQLEDFKSRNLFDEAINSCESFLAKFKKDPSVASEVNKLKEDLENAKKVYLNKKKEEGKIIFDTDNQDTDQWWSFSFLGPAPRLNVKNDILTLEDTVQDKGQMQQLKLPFSSCVCFGESSWSDYTIELEYKIVQGSAVLGLRFDYQVLKDAVQQVQQNGGKIQFNLPYALSLKRKFGADKWEKITVDIRDKNVIIKEEDKPERKEAMPAQIKSGGIGFLLRPGDKIIIKSIKIKGVD